MSSQAIAEEIVAYILIDRRVHACQPSDELNALRVARPRCVSQDVVNEIHLAFIFRRHRDVVGQEIIYQIPARLSATDRRIDEAFTLIVQHLVLLRSI